MIQLSHPYMTTGKSIALTTQTLVRKVMSLLCNMLSRFVIAFLPRSKSNPAIRFLGTYPAETHTYVYRRHAQNIGSVMAPN